MKHVPITLRLAEPGERYLWWSHAQAVGGVRDDGRSFRADAGLVVLNAYRGRKLVGSLCWKLCSLAEPEPELAEEGPYVRVPASDTAPVVAFRSIYVVPRERRRGLARRLAAELVTLDLPVYVEFRHAFLSRWFARDHRAAA